MIKVCVCMCVPERLEIFYNLHWFVTTKPEIGMESLL